MNENTKALSLIALGIILFTILFALSIDNQKTKCIENGGKWVTGIVNGGYSALCIPK